MVTFFLSNYADISGVETLAVTRMLVVHAKFLDVDPDRSLGLLQLLSTPIFLTEGPNSQAYLCRLYTKSKHKRYVGVNMVVMIQV